MPGRIFDKGRKAGSSTYPHVYNDYGGFTFAVAGPCYGFQILEGRLYTGGAPRAHQVIINQAGSVAGDITHTGSEWE